MGVDKGFCVEVFTAYPLQRYIPFVDGAVGIGGLILGFVYFAMSLLTLFLIRLNRRNALQGMEGAAMRVIFPIYLPLLLLSALSDTFVGLVVLFVPFKTRESNDWDAAIILATAYAIQHLVIEGSAFTLMQYGCGYQAFRNSIFWASGWALTTFLVKLAFYRQGADNDVAFALNFSWDIILFVFYFLLWTLPETRLYRRTAVRYYATFWTFIHLSVIIADAMYYFGKGSEDTTSLCIDSLVTLPIFVLCKPYVVYKSLLLDSVWWQGLPARSSGRGMGTGSGKTGNSVGDASLTDSLTKAFFRIVAGTSSHGGGSERGGTYERIRAEGGSDRSSNLSQRDSSLQSNDMLSGLLHPNSSRVAGMGGSGAGGSNSGKRLFEGKQYDSIQQPLDGVEVGFHEAQELAKEVDYIHQQGTTRFINSAHLTLDKPQRLLGAGSFSKVYAGYYKGSPVAMKMLFTQDINPDVIRRCSNEARILTEVSYSPHVVKIYGISVFPPSVCLVLELCPFGSLSDVLRGSNVQGVERPALKLTLADRMHLALGCALGLAALHNYSPDLCHRDIKSFNFLIDGQLNAKIADLDLGQQVIYPQKGSYSSDQSVNNTRQSLNSRGGGGGDGVTSATAYHGSGMNITWQAPEVLLGQGYTQKSDVYSLALVLWEIIASGRTMKKFSSSTYGGGGGGDIANMNITSTSIPVSSIPFNDCKDQREVREKIVLGYRPSLSSFITSFDQQEGGNSKDQKTSRRRSKSPIPPLTHNTSSFTSNNDTNVSKVYVDILYLDLITRAWSPEPRHRPSIDRLAEGLKRCYSNCLHRFITDTHFLVQYEKIHEEHVKMSLLHNTNQPLQTLPVSTSPHLRGGGMEAYHSMNRRTTGLTSSYPRNAPSRELIEAVSAMKAEVQWSKLEDDGAYVIITPIAPYYMLWATKRWTQVMGYFVNDLLGLDISLLFGPKTDVMALLSLLSTMITGHSLHIMSSLYRRDGREMTFSLNIFPVFDATGTTPIDSVPTSLDSSLQNTRTLLHATTFSPAHVHAPATPSQPSQTLPPPSPAPLLPPTPERTSSVGDTVLTQPPVGFLDLFSRSSSEFTTAKDFHIPATPSRGDVSQVRSISRGPPLTSDVESADRVTSPMKKGGGGNPLHFLPSDDESDTGGAGLLPSERSRMMDPTTSDIFSMSGTSMSNRKVAYIVLHFSSLNIAKKEEEEGYEVIIAIMYE